MIAYHLHNKAIPLFDPNNLYDYIIAGNGIFVRSVRPEFSAVVRISTTGLRGLEPLHPYFWMDNRISTLAMTLMLSRARERQVESLFYFQEQNNRWIMNVPDTKATPASVIPVNPNNPKYANVCMEVHTHPTMNAFFSGQDDADETSGFRVYGVLGHIQNEKPDALFRIGIYGHFGYVEANSIFHDGIDQLINDLYV